MPTLEQVYGRVGYPKTIRVDEGTGFVSRDPDLWAQYICTELQEWVDKRSTSLHHIEPGEPQQNTYIERYKRMDRHAWADAHIVETIEEGQYFAAQWLRT